MSRFSILCLWFAITLGSAAQTSETLPTIPKPDLAVFCLEGAGGKEFLVLDNSHAAVQVLDGPVRVMRVVAEPGDGLTGYDWGLPNGWRLLPDPATGSVVLKPATGTTKRFIRVMQPAESLGWIPYNLPAMTLDRQAKAGIAERLRQFAVEQQRLRAAYNSAVQTAIKVKRMREGLDKLPECKALITHGASVRDWLRQTLVSSGWVSSGYGPQVAADLATHMEHFVQDLRLLQTLRAGVQAELAQGCFPESAAAVILDAVADAFGEPMPYGSQVKFRKARGDVEGTYEQVIPVPTDLRIVEEARKRAGLPALAKAAQAAQATIVRLGDDGRQLSEVLMRKPGPVKIDPLLLDLAGRDPRAALQELAKRDPDFSAALVAAEKGQIDALSAWVRDSELADRMIFGIAIGNLPRQGPPADLAQALFAQRHLCVAFLAGCPATKQEEAPRISVSRDLATALAGRSAAPTAAELEQATALAPVLEKGLQRRDLQANPAIAHTMGDALACIYFRQGRMAEAAAMWKKAIGWAGKSVPESYRRRLQAAESGAKADALPR